MVDDFTKRCGARISYHPGRVRHACTDLPVACAARVAHARRLGSPAWASHCPLDRTLVFRARLIDIGGASGAPALAVAAHATCLSFHGVQRSVLPRMLCCLMRMCLYLMPACIWNCIVTVYTGAVLTCANAVTQPGRHAARCTGEACQGLSRRAQRRPSCGCSQLLLGLGSGFLSGALLCLLRPLGAVRCGPGWVVHWNNT